MATTKKNVNKNNSANNETKVVCPVCGSEFEIGAHEHTVKNAVVIGADSGLGTIALPVSKAGTGRIAALQAQGVDTSKYFAIQLPTGGEQLMKMDAEGKAVPVDAEDPILKNIMGQGTVPNRNLFRRWVMSQVFHGLQSRNGFTQWLKLHGYVYQWEMMVEELRVQEKLHRKGDVENFVERNRWFNKALAIDMAGDYIRKMLQDANSRPQHKCKGVPYVTIGCKHYFVSDIEKKLIGPMWAYIRAIETAKTPQALEQAVREFWKKAPVKDWHYKQCAKWMDAYKGMGAYATMKNLLLFHGCSFPKDNDFYNRRLTGMQMLQNAAHAYEGGKGWCLFGLMKQMMDKNHIDIEAKMKEWARAKSQRGLRR